MLNIKQIYELLDILNKQNLIFISSKLGPNYLSNEELDRLKSWGIDPIDIYNEVEDVVLTSFNFGILSDAIGEIDAKKVDFNAMKEYLSSGKHIPLTSIEKNTIASIKKQYLGDIKANNNRIFSDVNNIIDQSEKKNRIAYEKIIRDEVEGGTLLKKTNSQIAIELARKTGDWSRNFKRIVEYISHTAFNEGRAAFYEDKFGQDVLVYFQVFEGACNHCVKAYLKGGVSDDPKIFKLSDLKKNGSNIGRRVDEYKPTISSLHPYCRCTLHVSDEQKQKTKINRKPIKIIFNNKVYMA